MAKSVGHSRRTWQWRHWHSIDAKMPTTSYPQIPNSPAWQKLKKGTIASKSSSWDGDFGVGLGRPILMASGRLLWFSELQNSYWENRSGNFTSWHIVNAQTKDTEVGGRGDRAQRLWHRSCWEDFKKIFMRCWHDSCMKETNTKLGLGDVESTHPCPCLTHGSRLVVFSFGPIFTLSTEIVRTLLSSQTSWVPGVVGLLIGTV